METQLVNRYAVNMHGVLSCYDRILIMGTLPGACYAGGMSSLLCSRGIRILITRNLPSRCESVSVRERGRSVMLPGLRSSMSAKATSAKKSWRNACWPRAGA